MSSKVIVILEDDIDGSKASETITFAIDGAEYEIDLNTQNAQKLRDALRGVRKQGPQGERADPQDLKVVQRRRQLRCA